MAQVGWIFLDQQGGRHRVGVYHGDQSGHLVIHCNLRIVQIDFSVKESRTYSFFIEDEFCEVRLVREKIGFSYEFFVNKTANTPLNRARRVFEARNRRYMVALIGGMAFIIALFFIFSFWQRSRRDHLLAKNSLTNQLSAGAAQQLMEQGKNAEAQLFIVEQDGRRKVFYGFTTADSLRVSGIFSVPDTGAIWLPTGLPLQDRDVFALRYLPTEPRTHRLDFDRPGTATILGYMQAAAAAEQKKHPEYSKEKAYCIAKTVEQFRGWRFLGHLIRQTAKPPGSPTFNAESYLRLMRDPELERMLKINCWDR